MGLGETIRLSGGGRYSLSRTRDGAGDSGMMLESIDPTTAKRHGENGEVTVGCCLRCGSMYARTMQDQDWWLTTPVTAILEKADDNSWVKVRTRSSDYLVKSS
jgi:hypothetical protein